MSEKRFYIETYGCQMNFADTEVVNSILLENGMSPVTRAEDADVIFVNTCSIRENAETRVWNRLKEFRSLKREKEHLTVGVLGCMAERVRRSEEHTSELQSRGHLVCRLLLEKKNKHHVTR